MFLPVHTPKSVWKIFDKISLPIAVTSFDGKAVFTNQSFIKIFNFSFGRNLFENEAEFYYDDLHRERCKLYSKQAFETPSKKLVITEKFRTPFGIRAFLVERTIIQTEENQPLLMIQFTKAGVFYDQLSEEKSKARKQPFLEKLIDENIDLPNLISIWSNYSQLIANNLTEFILIKDIKGRYQFVNTAFADTLGLSIEDIIGKKDADLFESKKFIDQFTKHDQLIFKDRQSILIENQLYTFEKVGNRNLKISKIPLLNKLGVVTFCLSIVTDVTELDTATESLRKSEEQFRLLFENAFEGLEIHEGTLDEGGNSKVKLLARNEKMRKIFDRNDQEMNKLKTIEISPDYQPNGKKTSELILEQRKKLIEKGSIIFEWQFFKKDGAPVFIESSNYILPTKERSLIFTIARDITNSKIQNQLIEKTGKELSMKNIELDKYIESNSELENFAFYAAHDLKAPLRSIISFSQLLHKNTKDRLSETELEYFDFIFSASNNMNQLISDLLAFSRVNTEKYKPHSINLNTIIEEILLELNPEIKESNAFIYQQNLPSRINVDPIKFKQLFRNLIANAIKFGKENIPPQITIDCLENETEYQFSVSDNGIGIEEVYFNQIFALFKKLHGIAEYEGTGIGLALCKRIVEQHGGAIGVSSTLNIGSNFYFNIPKTIG